MSTNSNNYMKDAFSSSLGDFISSIGEGVGEAQAALDEGSLRQTLEIYNNDPDKSDETLKLLREIGYQPTFYTIPKTTAKAKISLTISQQTDSVNTNGRPMRTKMYATPINATNTNKYNISLQASAEIQFDIMPVPPSDAQIIRFLPNFIKDKDGNKRTFKEIKLLLNDYSLEYQFEKDTDESLITDETLFENQIPEYVENKVVKAGDVIILSLNKKIKNN